MKNSECQAGFLHDFEIQVIYPDGVLEVCQKCRKKKYFRNETPNHVYLSYHARIALQSYHRRYAKEYGR